MTPIVSRGKVSDISIRQAGIADAQHIVAVLREAASWLDQRGISMWREEIMPDRIIAEISSGLFFVAQCSGEIAGTLKFQLEDKQFWPDVPQDDSAFVHRLAVLRRFAGGTVSRALLQWAVERARGLGRQFLRLDCETSRPRLRTFLRTFWFPASQRPAGRGIFCCPLRIPAR